MGARRGSEMSGGSYVWQPPSESSLRRLMSHLQQVLRWAARR